MFNTQFSILLSLLLGSFFCFTFTLVIEKTEQTKSPTYIKAWALSWFIIFFIIFLFCPKKAEEVKEEAKIGVSAEAAVGTQE